MAATANELALRNEVQRVFTLDNRFTFERYISAGADGFTMLFRMRRDNGSSVPLALKRPGDNEQVLYDNINQELNWLKKLKWVEHVVNLIPIKNNPALPGNGRAGLPGPTICMEYLQNGTLFRFMTRSRREYLPNRLLNFIFLCLVRASVGMAWQPPRANDDGTLPRELPLDHFQASSLVHSDLHWRNLMFGNIDPAQFEHSLVPILKMIDFGQASDTLDRGEIPLGARMDDFDSRLGLENFRTKYGVRNSGIDFNIQNIGRIMASIITKSPRSNLFKLRVDMQNQITHPYLDDDIRRLILRCLAVEPENRPPLEELLATLNGNMSLKTAAYYANTPRGASETDENIREVVSRCILSGDT
ncbi:kinase-like domain-containing protein [Xylariaceae sp. FL0016]|nr:kinase-like domain-containing protein [Xylariaceae sp. FL0016]